MTQGEAILEVPVMIQHGGILEVLVAVHMCQEVEALVIAIAMVAGAGGTFSFLAV